MPTSSSQAVQSGKDLEKWVEANYPAREFNRRLSDSERNEAINKLRRAKALYGKIKTVLENENRWTEERKVREMLATVASLDLP